MAAALAVSLAGLAWLFHTLSSRPGQQQLVKTRARYNSWLAGATAAVFAVYGVLLLLAAIVGWELY